jgi:raffinose/stachyose/melibiose transport system permease protein
VAARAQTTGVAADVAAGPGSRLRARRRGPRGSGRAPGEPRNIGWLYALPGILFYLLFTLLPLGHAVQLSFFDWDGLTQGTYVGLDNYREALSDPLVRGSFQHALVLILFYSLLPISIGLLLTAVLTRRPLRGFTFYRAALFLPQTIAGVVIAQAWVWIYADAGPVNEALRAIGLGDVARAWLGEFETALPAVGTIGTWVTFGLCMVLFIAGVQKIPEALYDAARVDGAGPFRELIHITLPGLRNELVLALVLTVINALRSFDVIYNTTAGGPGTETYVPAIAMYFNAFVYNRVGYACAIAVLLALAICLVAVLITRVAGRGDA